MATTPNYDLPKVQHFEKLFQGALEYASNTSLPLCVIEGACRDALAQVEAQRLLNALRARGAKL